LTVPLPDPDAPDVIVRKLALLLAAHAQLENTGIDPVVAAALTTFCGCTPTLTRHAGEGELSCVEHAAAASAAVAAIKEASNSRWYLIC
jgi:hypothetical protein